MPSFVHKGRSLSPEIKSLVSFCHQYTVLAVVHTFHCAHSRLLLESHKMPSPLGFEHLQQTIYTRMKAVIGCIFTVLEHFKYQKPSFTTDKTSTYRVAIPMQFSKVNRVDSIIRLAYYPSRSQNVPCINLTAKFSNTIPSEAAKNAST